MSNSDPQSSPAATTKGILLVEEYGALAIAISSALKKFAPLHGIRVASNLAEAEQAVSEMDPDLFVLDLDPPPAGEIDFLVKLQKRFPDARMLVIAAGTSRELQALRGTTGAVQFIEKPFELGDFGAAVQALLGPWATPPTENIRGTLRDLNVIDIVQLKCLALSSTVVRLETPDGKKGEIHFEHGEITHATAGNLSGISALEEIVRWPSGNFTETATPENAPRTINDPWSAVLLQASRKATEKSSAPRKPAPPAAAASKRGKTILAIDDTEMLLIFAADVLVTADSSFDVVSALTGREGLKMAEQLQPDLILLDYSLTDTTGADVCRELLANEATAHIPVLMMSGHLPELANTAATYRNVVAILPKPFLSGALINAVAKSLAAGPLPIAPPPPPPAVAKTLPADSPSPQSASIVPSAPPVKTEPPAERLPNGNGQSHPPDSPPPPSAALKVAPPLAAFGASRIPEQVAIPAETGENILRVVRVTFSFEVLAMQLTPDFRMDALQLKPAESAVGVRVADGGEMGMLVKTGFRLGRVQLADNGRIGTMTLVPTSQPPRFAAGGNAFAVSAIRAQPVAQDRVVELTGESSEAMRVQLTAPFEFLKVELSPTLEVTAVVLRARDGEMELGSGEEPATALFTIEQVRVDETGGLSELFVRAKR